MRKYCALRKDNPAVHRTQRSNRFKLVLMVMICNMVMGGYVLADSGQARPQQDNEDTSFFGQSIGLYQKILSRADGNRCPMYPSCSAYAKQAFQKHGPLKGWILTTDRLLRCGHDEVALSGQIRIRGNRVTPDPLDKNDFLFK